MKISDAKKFRYFYVIYDPNLGEYTLLKANSKEHALKRYREEWRYAEVGDDYWKLVAGNMMIRTWSQHLKDTLRDKQKKMLKHFRRRPDSIDTMSSILGPLSDFGH